MSLAYHRQWFRGIRLANGMMCSSGFIVINGCRPEDVRKPGGEVRVGIDTTITRVNPAGPGVYVHSLLKAIEGLDKAPHIFPLMAPSPATEPRKKTISSRVLTLYRDLIWTHCVLRTVVAGLDLDILHMPAYAIPIFPPVDSVVTMFDMSIIEMGASFTPWHRLYSRLMIPYSAGRANAIITGSTFSKRRIVDILGTIENKIVVCPLAPSSRFAPIAEDRVGRWKNAHGLDDFILSVGTVEPRKNLLRLVSALETLHHKDVNVPIIHVGPLGWKYEATLAKLERSDLSERIQLWGTVSEEELANLYNAASLLVYPSLYEGFGLPNLEAMACGCPVVTSNTSAIPEVVGDAALLVDPEDSVAIADGIHDVLTDQDLAANLREKGLARARQFSWERTASQTIDVYRQVLARQ
jgi:glycosyltransferase involved in cell wall biosynthesis